MRDKNLTLQKFNIQLERIITSKLRDDRSLRTAVSDSPKCLDPDQVIVNYPRDFRSLRSLTIFQWYLPENLHWRILLDLQEKEHSQLNEKQKLELSILLSSKENCSFYLWKTERYSSREIFGNILGNELNSCLKTLKIKRKTLQSPEKVQRHRGYRDKGSLRPSHRWLESFDSSFTEYQNKLEKKRILHQKLLTKLLLIISEEREFCLKETPVRRIDS